MPSPRIGSTKCRGDVLRDPQLVHTLAYQQVQRLPRSHMVHTCIRGCTHGDAANQKHMNNALTCYPACVCASTAQHSDVGLYMRCASRMWQMSQAITLQNT